MWEEAFINTMVLFRRNLEAKPDVGGVIDTVAQIYDSADRLFEEAVAAGPEIAEGRKSLACAEGCSHCCYLQVAVSGAEAIAIGTYLRVALPEDGLDTFAAALGVRAGQVAGKSAMERAWMKIPCPLLSENRCSAYSIRPLQCRSACSTDQALCALSLEEGQAPPINSLSAQVETFKGVLAVLIKVEEEMGLKPGPYDLIPALAVILSDDTAGPRWLAGEDVFEDARLEMVVDGA